MPTKGKCWSCGDEAYLYCQLLYNLEKQCLEVHMVCAICKKYYEKKAVKRDVNTGIDQ